MNRRDFLRLRLRGGERLVELSCERLYMRYVDAESAVAAGQPDGAPSPEWEGEPPTEIAVTTTDELFAEIDQWLASADVLQVVGVEWLSDAALAGRVDALIEAFQRRGGRVARADSVAIRS